MEIAPIKKILTAHLRSSCDKKDKNPFCNIDKFNFNILCCLNIQILIQIVENIALTCNRIMFPPFLHVVLDESNQCNAIEDEFPIYMGCDTSGCHAFSMLSELEKDRKGEQEFCDATISTESRDFKVHKCVVSAASVFFRKLFSSQMKEKHESKAIIMTVAPKIMEVILDFIYTSELAISDDNVYDLLCASDFFQMQDIKRHCGIYLQDNLTDKNCFLTWNFAKMFNMKRLKFHTKIFISAKFMEIMKKELYKELSVDNFIDYLGLRNKTVWQFDHIYHYFTTTTSEIDLYNAIVIWAQSDLLKRQEYLCEVFSQIDLTKIPREYLLSTVSKEPIIHSSPGCTKLVIDALCQKIEEKVKKYLVQELFLVGGTPWKYDFARLNLQTKTLIPGPNMPGGGRSGASAAIVNDHLYVIGGVCWSFDEQKSHNTFISLDLKDPTGTWKIWKQTMKQNRLSAGCTVLDGYIYMCGGKCDHSLSLNSCERFHVASRNWFSISGMNHKRSEFELVALDGKLYAIGGLERPCSYMNSVDVFDPNLGTWSEATPLRTPRARFAAAVWNGAIYVIGGVGQLEYLKSVEKYSPDSEKWIFVSSMNERRFNHFSAAVFGDEILVFGGSTKLEAYECSKDKWTTKLPIIPKFDDAVVRFER